MDFLEVNIDVKVLDDHQNNLGWTNQLDASRLNLFFFSKALAKITLLLFDSLPLTSNWNSTMIIGIHSSNSTRAHFRPTPNSEGERATVDAFSQICYRFYSKWRLLASYQLNRRKDGVFVKLNQLNRAKKRNNGTGYCIPQIRYTKGAFRDDASVDMKG
ncbi:10220_t:CDS:2 [Acaulospora morrowiae]|uniref:10220_t:CDS:1 n=1 Tax=Acaulospora morrowiae TaxID=94023 RepID=A0A9N9A0B2_9GLOM|nr:10220_t:CDS:2 [Acaulospora morrowiae]